MIGNLHPVISSPVITKGRFHVMVPHAFSWSPDSDGVGRRLPLFSPSSGRFKVVFWQEISVHKSEVDCVIVPQLACDLCASLVGYDGRCQWWRPQTSYHRRTAVYRLVDPSLSTQKYSTSRPKKGYLQECTQSSIPWFWGRLRWT